MNTSADQDGNGHVDKENRLCWYHWAILLCVALALGLMLMHYMQLRRPYWTEPDPDYLYLHSTLKMARWVPVAFNDHPGVTVKVIGALVFRGMHCVLGKGTLQEDVLRDPELYVAGYNYVAILLNVLALFWLSVVTYRKTGELCCALASYMTVVVVLEHFVYNQTKLGGEGILFLMGTCLGTLCIAALHEHRPREWFWLAVGCGVVMGLGTTAKFNFAPLGMAALIAVPKIRWKSVYLAACAVTTAVMTLVVISEISQVKGTVLRSLATGEHGSGGMTMAGGEIVRLLRDFVRYDQPFFVVLAVAGVAIVLGMLLFLLPFGRERVSKRAWWVTFGLMVGMGIQVVLVAKNKLNYYMVPAMSLTGPILIASFSMVRWRAWHAQCIWRVLMVVVMACIACFALKSHGRTVTIASDIWRTRRAESEGFLARMDRTLSNYAVVCDAVAMAPQAALSFGNVGNDNIDVMTNLYPSTYIYASYLPKPETCHQWNIPIGLDDIIVRHTNVALVVRGSMVRGQVRLPERPMHLAATSACLAAYVFDDAYVQRLLAAWSASVTVPKEISVRYARHTDLMYLNSGHGTPEKPVLTWGSTNPVKHVEFVVVARTAGVYRLSVVYAAAGSHPLDVYVNGTMTFEKVCGVRTGGYDPQFATNMCLGPVSLAKGENRVRLEMASAPCIAAIRIDE